MLALKSIGKSTFAPKGMRSVYGVRIGNREVVGHGCNSQPVYKDDSHFPFPAIRFKERSPEIEVLREKEKGDWRQLSKTEKKTFYRTSFCQTFSEFQVNTGAWKAILGGVLFTTSFTFWCQIFIKQYVNEPMPESTSEESQRVQLQRMLDLQVNPIDGLSSQWDYEKGHWKALREKEKGDWKLLCCEEKKALYRASFCQTFAEFQVNTGTWKAILGAVFFTTSFAFWAFIYYHYYVAEPLPISLSKKSQKDQLRRMIEIRTNPIDGLASKWDYANDQWLWKTEQEANNKKT